MAFQKSLTPEQALQKLKHYCAYQERCHQEVAQKLYDLGVRRSEHDRILAALIEENYLNEERFAVAYAGGHFRMKQWGRTRIVYALKQKKVSPYCIKKALQQIDEEVYEKTLRQLAEEKYRSLKKDQYLVRKKKTIDYLLYKGYEHDLVNKSVARLSGKGDTRTDQ
jgi:regulatory protein